jgi:O-antigen ligase
MMRLLFTRLFETGIFLFAVAVLLFGGSNWQPLSGFATFAQQKAINIFENTETQWMVYFGVAIYFVVFVFLRFRSKFNSIQRRKNASAFFLLGGLFLVSTGLYVTYYGPSTAALTLLAGAFVGQGIAAWSGFNCTSYLAPRIPCLFVLLLTLAAFRTMNYGQSFVYNSRMRWCGPWGNPNIFGLLMGVGLVLAVGCTVSSCKLQVLNPTGVRDWKVKIRKYSCIVFSLFAAIFLARGLLHSFSRGAWVATAIGLSCLLIVGFCFLDPKNIQSKSEIRLRISQLSENWLLLVMIAASVFVLVFWHFRQTKWHPARRALSAVNPIDFSWRNRVSAWEGALQITAEHPWLGLGWNHTEPTYEYYYLSPRLTESAAIQMNDYLTLGATLGIPALFCFLVYIWLSLIRNVECGTRNIKIRGQQSEGREQKAEVRNGRDVGAALEDSPPSHPDPLPSLRERRGDKSGKDRLGTRSSKFETAELNWLQATCRAGAIVLLVGFWFDGGVFKLPTASTFWILLELGRRDLVQQKETKGTETGSTESSPVPA